MMFKKLEFIWKEEKEDWVIIKEIKDGKAVNFIIKNNKKGIVIDTDDDDYKLKVIEKLLAEGIAFVEKNID